MLSIFMKKLTVNEAKNKVTTSDVYYRKLLPQTKRCHEEI